MSRPLTGRLVANKAGTFTASVPVAQGSDKRKPGTFEVRAQAQGWLDACVAARHAGRELPDPEEFKGTRRPATASRTRFADIAELWIREHYVEDGHGDIGREDQVRHYVEVIDAYLAKQGLYLEGIARDDARAMYRAFKATPTGTDPALPADLNSEDLVTRKEACTLLAEHGQAASESSFKRALATRRLKPAGSRGRAHLYRVDDVFDAANGLTNTRRADGPQYAHSTLKDVRRAFRAVLAHATVEGVSIQPGVRKAGLPKDKSPKAKTRALTLSEMARLARHLHVVHQLVLLLLRLLGLRISEAYGLRVEDVIDAGPGQPGLLTVQSQGGRSFKTRGPQGTVEVTDHKDGTKRDSWRVLVVPAQLMDVIRTIIEGFHLDDNGAWRPDARLVPGLQQGDKAGQGAFRDALKTAAADEGIDIEIEAGRRRQRGERRMNRVAVTPQAMRRSFITALQAGRAVVENIRLFVGHRRGEDVIHLHYLLEDPELKPQRDVAATLASQIEADLPEGLMVPTAKRCTTHNQKALALRAAEIDAYLTDLGWQVDDLPDGDWITVAAAAELRGVTPTQIRDDIAAGRLTARKVPRGDNGRYTYLVDAGEALDGPAAMSGGSEMRALADELGVPYDRVRQYVRRHPSMDIGPKVGREYRVSDAQAEDIRGYFLEQSVLAERAVAVPEVSKTLGISVASLSTLINRGWLVEDLRMHGGVRSITKDSLECYQRTCGRRHRSA